MQKAARAWCPSRDTVPKKILPDQTKEKKGEQWMHQDSLCEFAPMALDGRTIDRPPILRGEPPSVALPAPGGGGRAVVFVTPRLSLPARRPARPSPTSATESEMRNLALQWERGVCGGEGRKGGKRISGQKRCFIASYDCGCERTACAHTVTGRSRREMLLCTWFSPHN